LSLLYLLANLHFEVAYVHSVTNSPMPMYLRLTAWWGGQAGSLLFWSWLMALYASTVAWRDWSRDREFLPWVIMVTGLSRLEAPSSSCRLRAGASTPCFATPG